MLCSCCSSPRTTDDGGRGIDNLVAHPGICSSILCELVSFGDPALGEGWTCLPNFPLHLSDAAMLPAKGMPYLCVALYLLFMRYCGLDMRKSWNPLSKQKQNGEKTQIK
jgi:hypothetical protein